MLTEDMRAHLTEKVLPFWENLADEENGGYYGYVDQDLTVRRDAHKGCILNSRILWTFATAARVLGEERYLTYARRALDFMAKFEDREQGGVYWSVSAEGEPLDKTKHTYCQAFTIYGLAAYVRATGDQDALNKAMALFHIIEDRCCDEGGYGEAYKLDFSPESNEKLSENGVMASRTMNTLLHVLEAYAELYRAYPDEEVRAAGIVCLERFLNVMYSAKERRLEVFFDAEYKPLLDMQSYGHDIEGSWLIWDAVQTLLPEAEQAPYREMCKVLAGAVYERAWTDHGLKNECVDGEVNELRIWWVQAETILGFANAYKLTGEEKYCKAVEDEWAYIQKVIVDPREGSEWFWCTEEDGTPTAGKPIVEEWKCPYHNGRMVLRMLENA